MTKKIEEFKSDGCSGGMSLIWDKFSKEHIPWEGLCVIHDIEYWIGGTKEDRKLADSALRDGVEKRGYPMMARLMYSAVRIGGSPYLPFGWRWAFGYPQGRSYEKRSKFESSQIKIELNKLNTTK